MTRTCSKSTKGTELTIGNKTLGFGIIVKLVPGQLAAGAKYQDATFDDGNTHRCWEGFEYHVECEVELNLENATPAELAQMA